jgi:hypothetical protein
MKVEKQSDRLRNSPYIDKIYLFHIEGRVKIFYENLEDVGGEKYD